MAASYKAGLYLRGVAGCAELAGPCKSVCGGCGETTYSAMDFCHYRLCNGDILVSNSSHSTIPTAESVGTACPIPALAKCSGVSYLYCPIKETDGPSMPYSGYVSACVTYQKKHPIVGELTGTMLDALSGSSTHNIWTNIVYNT